jgi:maltoporin
MASGERRRDETLNIYISSIPYISFQKQIARINAFFQIICLLKNGSLETSSIVKALPYKYSTTCRYLAELMFYSVIRIRGIAKNGQRIYELAPNWQTALLSIPGIQEFQSFLKHYWEVIQDDG